MTTYQPIFPDLKLATHMPFFDGETLLFCQANAIAEKTFVNKGSIWKRAQNNPVLANPLKSFPKTQCFRYRPWKLARCEWASKSIAPVLTGLPEESIECSPAFYREKDRVHLSFIGGLFTETGITYQLYVMSGPDFDHLEQAQPLPVDKTRMGFVSPQHICIGQGRSLIFLDKNCKTLFRIETDFASLIRATFIASDPSKILITGADGERKFRTILHELESGKTFTVSAGEDIYKSTLHQDQLIFALQNSDDFENRRLCESSFELNPSDIRVTLKS